MFWQVDYLSPNDELGNRTTKKATRKKSKHRSYDVTTAKNINRIDEFFGLFWSVNASKPKQGRPQIVWLGETQRAQTKQDTLNQFVEINQSTSWSEMSMDDPCELMADGGEFGESSWSTYQTTKKNIIWRVERKSSTQLWWSDHSMAAHTTIFVHVLAWRAMMRLEVDKKCHFSSISSQSVEIWDGEL